MVNPVISFAGVGCIDNSDRSMEAKITGNNIGKRNHSPCEDTYTYQKYYTDKSIGKSIRGRFEFIA